MYILHICQHTWHDVWSVLVFLGVNLPDHEALFAALSSQLRDKVTPYIATLQARHCNTLRSTIEHMVLQLMNYNKLHNVSLCTAFEQNLILNCDNVRLEVSRVVKIFFFWILTLRYQHFEGTCKFCLLGRSRSQLWDNMTSLPSRPQLTSSLLWNPQILYVHRSLTSLPFLEMFPNIVWMFEWNPSFTLLIGRWLGERSEGQCKEDSV